MTATVTLPVTLDVRLHEEEAIPEPTPAEAPPPRTAQGEEDPS